MDIDSRNEAIDHVLADRVVGLEFANMLLGELLGSGASRYVFQHATHKNRVVKIDMSDWNANVTEYQVWQRIQYVKRINKWFAQCPQMSRCGRILIMEKVDMNRGISAYPKMVPSFFTDIKWANFGFIGKQLVCCDYASNLLMEEGMKVKLVKAEW
jgi:hypothetical protein